MRKLFLIAIAVYTQMFEMRSTACAQPPPPSLATRMVVEDLIHRLATAPPQQRKLIIEDIYGVAASTNPRDRNALSYFGYNIIVNTDGTHLMKPKSYGNPTLYRVIPILISMLDDATQASKVFWILANLQSACPEPKRVVWEKWWKEIGAKSYYPYARQRWSFPILEGLSPLVL